MSSTSRVLVTIGIIIGFIFIFGLLVAGNSGKSPGFLGVILFFGMAAGIRAIWKKTPQTKDDHQLDKRE